MEDSLAAFTQQKNLKAVEKAEEGVKVLAKADGNIVAVQYKNQIGMSFHPELDEDDRIHQLFLDTVKKNK